jgi:hypothetical protein
MLSNWKVLLLAAASLVLAASTGYLAATALGLGTAGSPPTKTTTVNVGQGATGPKGDPGPAGPAGPAGPPGPAGGGGPEDCPTGSSFQAVVLNAPGGQVEIWTCVAG